MFGLLLCATSGPLGEETRCKFPDELLTENTRRDLTGMIADRLRKDAYRHSGRNPAQLQLPLAPWAPAMDRPLCLKPTAGFWNISPQKSVLGPWETAVCCSFLTGFSSVLGGAWAAEAPQDTKLKMQNPLHQGKALWCRSSGLPVQVLCRWWAVY